MSTSKKGFTLVELIVVIVIIGILSAVALPKLVEVTYKARTAQIPITVNTITKAEEVHYAEEQVYIAAPWADVNGNQTNDILEDSFDIISDGDFFYYGVTTPEDNKFNVEVWVSQSFANIALNTKATITQENVHTYSNGDATSIANLRKYSTYLD